MFDEDEQMIDGQGNIVLAQAGNYPLEQPEPVRAPWITIQRYASGDACWKVVKVEYWNAGEDGNNGSANIYVETLGPDGHPCVEVNCVQDWQDDQAEKKTMLKSSGIGTEDYGKVVAQVDFFMAGSHGSDGGSSFDPTKGQVGPYSVYIKDGYTATEIVRGLGLPLNRHVQYRVVFQYIAVDIPPEPEKPQTLDEAALAVAKSVTWMPLNTGAALYQYGRQNNLDYPQTDELCFAFDGKQYVLQVWNKGIIYCEVGKYQGMYIIPK